MPVKQTAGYRMFKHAHTIIPIIDESDISQGVVIAMVRRFKLNLSKKQVRLGQIILSEQVTLGSRESGAKNHAIHLVMCAEINEIPKALTTAAKMLGIPTKEKVGILLNKHKPDITAVADRIAKVDRFKTATIILM